MRTNHLITAAAHDPLRAPRAHRQQIRPMRWTTALWMLVLLSTQASAQSLIGSTLSYRTIGSNLDSSFGTVEVGSGAEFTVTGQGTTYTVDIDASSITITADLPDLLLNTNWGNLGGGVVGGLIIEDMIFDTCEGIAIAGTSGSAGFDPTDFALADGVLSIANSADFNFIAWRDGQTIRINLAPDPNAYAPRVKNVSFGTSYETIEEALTWAFPGETLELGPCTFVERNLDVGGLTLRGQGAMRTVIDGGGVPGSILTANAPTAATTIEALTLRNGVAGVEIAGRPARGGAISVVDANPLIIRDCLITENDSIGGQVAGLFADSSDVRLEYTVFRANTDSDSSNQPVPADIQAVGRGMRVVAANCVFDDTGAARSPFQVFLRRSNIDPIPSPSRFINCTFVLRSPDAVNVLPPVKAEFWNCVFSSGRPFTSNGTVVAGNSLFGVQPNFSFIDAGGNINGVPTFVDASNADLRLAPGSLGIDAADYTIYTTGGFGPLDLAQSDRTDNDPGTPDTGIGLIKTLDMGAFEFRGVTTSPMSGDFNMDGFADIFDITDLLDLIDGN